MLRTLMLFAASLAAASPGLAHPEPLTIGERHVLEAMDAVREVNVILPQGYADAPDARYPVVYFLDGGTSQDLMIQAGMLHWTSMWGRTSPAILVGIETKDRQRELLPPTTDAEALAAWPSAGESAAFRTYLRDDVMPLIAASYRTDGRDLLVGESAAGHFVVETLLREPEMFDGYAAISPSLWWEEQFLAREAEAKGAGEAPLFISIANEGETMDEGVRRIVAVRAESGHPACFADRGDLTHGVAYHALLPSALQYLLPGAEPLPAEWGMVTGCTQ